jgi:hypothetical protein
VGAESSQTSSFCHCALHLRARAGSAVTASAMRRRQPRRARAAGGSPSRTAVVSAHAERVAGARVEKQHQCGGSEHLVAFGS